MEPTTMNNQKDRMEFERMFEIFKQESLYEPHTLETVRKVIFALISEYPTTWVFNYTPFLGDIEHNMLVVSANDMKHPERMVFLVASRKHLGYYTVGCFDDDCSYEELVYKFKGFAKDND